MSEKRTDAQEEERNDGFLNVVTGIGTNKDKRTFNQSVWINRDLEFYEQLYSSDELAARLVDSIPETAMRKWIELTSVEKDVATAIEEKCKDLNLRDAILKAWIYARTYGGSILYLVSKTGMPSEPLKQGEEIIAAVPLSRYDVRIYSSDVDSDFASPNYSRPRQYFLNVQMGSQYKGYPVHWSRCIRFDGDTVPRRTYIRNNYWHDSILNKLYNPIRNYQSANDNAASILQDFNMGVYKMKNLAHLISSGKEDVVKSRLEILQFSKSVINAMVLDSEDEDYVDVARNVNGMAEMLRAQANRLVAATDIPHTILLGESPDGSNATGNSTTQQWNNYIESEQNNYLRPKLDRAFDIIFNDVKDPFEYKFKNLYDLDEQQMADLRAKQASTDAIYLDRSVVDAEEIAESRFGGEQYSTETHLDKETREAFGPPAPPVIDDEPTDEPLVNENAGADKKMDNEPYKQPNSFDNKIGQLPEEAYNPHHEQDMIEGGGSFKKEEPMVSISQSTPFKQPELEEMYWLKDTKTKTYTAKMDNVDVPVVVTIECNLDGKMLMGQRKDTGMWTQPGGHADPGEAPRHAAARELYEEAGIAVHPDDLEFVQARRIKTRRNDLNIYHYRIDFENEAVATNPQGDPDKECNSWHFKSDEECAKLVGKLHAPKNIIFEKRGLLGRKDAGESAFMPRQLDQTKKKPKDVKYQDKDLNYQKNDKSEK